LHSYIIEGIKIERRDTVPARIRYLISLSITNVTHVNYTLFALKIKLERGKGKKMEKNDKIREEIMRECENWKERLLVRLFPSIFVKVYHIGRIDTFNHMVD